MNNIFLIGFMGCGKSTVALQLSKQYGMHVLEMDQMIVEQQNMSIADIFEQHGEVYFRDLETQLLESISPQSNQVVSCGGGVVLRAENVELMKQRGKIVLLRAKPETILERVKHDTNRPLLKGNKNVDFIQSMMEQRCLKYEQAADYVVETDNKSASLICAEIMKQVQR